ncbi:MAG: DNA cytosine methyltransferase [Nevskiales bacterium]
MPAVEKRAPKFLAVDFFCGAGGTTRGLIDAGGYVIAGIDKDDKCELTFATNNKNAALDRAAPTFLHYDLFPKTRRYRWGQQSELRSELHDLIPFYKKQAPHAPLLFAICAPCQPFTRLSRKEMTKARLAKRSKDRNLLGEAVKFVEYFKPELVLSENVRGIGDPQYGGIWADFIERLEEAGYVTGSKVICTSRFGIAQYRKRSILIAVRRRLVRSERCADTSKRALLVPECNPDTPPVSVQEALAHFPPLKAGEQHPVIPNHLTRALSKLNKQRLRAALPGQSNAYMEDTPHGDLSLKCHKRVNKRLRDRCFNDVYTRMRSNHPAPTITTKCHSISNGRFGHYEVGQVRGISLREAAALQSFPDDYVFFPIDQQEPVARMIGNAVPPRLAEFFSDYLVHSI